MIMVERGGSGDITEEMRFYLLNFTQNLSRRQKKNRQDKFVYFVETTLFTLRVYDVDIVK